MKSRLTKAEIEERLSLLERGIKFCPNCKQNKSPDDFAKDTRHYDGLQTYCRDCCNLLRRTKYGEKIRETARNTHYKNKEKNNACALRYYRENKDYLQSKANEWKDKNKERMSEYKKQYHQDHKEYENELAKARMRQWRKDNPGKFRANCHRRQQREELAGPHYTGEQWETLLTLCGNKCLVCGSTDNIEADHVIPVSKGGTNDISNIQPLCKSCNCSKHNVHNTDYRPAHVKQWAIEQVTAP